MVSLTTSSQFKLALDAVKTNKGHAIPAVKEYLSLLSDQLEEFRIPSNSDPFDDAVVESIESFLPYRNEFVDLLLAIALYRDDQDTRETLHHFFERLIPYLERPEHISQWRDWDFDNFRFIAQELFLYAVACLIRHERFESASYLLSTDYYVPSLSQYGQSPMVPFTVFSQPLKSLLQRKQRLGLSRMSLKADLLEQRCKGLGLEFRDLMQADFVLFMRASLETREDSGHWSPDTLVYAERFSGPFEIFARSRSVAYFNNVEILLGITGKEDLEAVVEAFAADRSFVPRWDYRSLNAAGLLGVPDIATRP